MRTPLRPARCGVRLAFLLSPLLALALASTTAFAQNPIVAENQLTGSPPAEWDVSGSGDASIQGFATDIGVNRGASIGFKVSTDAVQYEIRIYRLGYYQGNGARLVTTLGPFGGTVQSVPSPDPVTGLVDCGGWTLAATWNVPSTAVSGIYVARLVRLDTQGASHVAFVVRDDASTSDLYFKTADATWQAYNVYGGNSLYLGSAPFPSGHAAKVSYNRPFVTRAGGGGGGAGEDWLFNAEYPMVRWLESNGYDVSYTTDVDADRNGALIANHRALLCVGHDEYWSAAERANVEAARDAGTHLAFLDGNEIYWKTRWETSTDGSGTPYRTLVCYKEGTLGENACGSKCDPLPDTWTGLWRDGCAYTPPADGCRPENALSGQISWGDVEGSLLVPDTFKDHRLWRNTSVASLGSGQTATLGSRILGYEFDYEQYAASAPAGRVTLSETALGGHTHRLSLYRAPSGALVFGAGTVQWAWGLDPNHDRGSDAAVPAIQQATVNLFAEMGVQPATLQSGLVAATATGDASPPVSAIAAPAAGDTLALGVGATFSGTAGEVGGGVVAAVEVSVDGGATWARATGTTTWSYAWAPAATGTITLLARAVDDLGNLESPAAGVSVTVVDAGAAQCPCTVFLPSESPAHPDNNDGQPIEPGMKFRATEDGLVTGVRYYKGSGWTSGTRTGHLWSYPAGTQLAEVEFTGESASGWQEATFPTPVAVTAGTTYVVSVFSSAGNYAFDGAYFANALARPPLRALADGEDGPNGVYHYGSAGYPTSNFNASNYWVDVVYENGPDTTPPTVASTSPVDGATGVSAYAPVRATFGEALDPATVTTATFELRDAADALVPATVAYDASTRTATLTPGVVLVNDAVYTATLVGAPASPRIQDVAGNALAADVTWSFTVAPPDLTPPSVSARSPLPGATAVSVNAIVQATFDEALAPATVSVSTFELRDSTGSLVPATVSYNVYPHVALLTPAAPLAAQAVYTATLHGGATDPRVKDLAGNALATDVSWSFSTGDGYGCPCTVFQPGDSPSLTDVTDGQPLEMGMKFQATVNGWATGVRFFKGASNTGAHTGHLWTGAGTLLGEATFSGETVSGWQQALFASPIAITAGQTYVVSYHSPSYFSVTTQFFTADVVNGPLVALAGSTGENGPNGVYAYSSTPAFPTQAGGAPYNQSNYWVDVVFATEVGPDVTPPTVTATGPGDGAAGVAVSTSVTATFSETLDPATVTGTTFTLRQGAGAPLAATVSWNAASLRATLVPSTPLAWSTTYTATLSGGASSPRLQDPAGNALAADVLWTFTTGAEPPPPPDEGPGGPILVVSSAADPFTRYYAEILRCEGLNGFLVRDLSLVSAATLDSAEVVILAATGLTAPQVTMFSDWVTAGGDLVAMRPDAALAPLLGLGAIAGTLSNAYLQVDTTRAPGRGIVGASMQFHHDADEWSTSDATPVATLFSDATTPTAYPAVTVRAVGGNGGHAAAFTYDLARSIVYTRQGNPAWSGQERDGTSPIRSDDLFYGAAASDPQPDWIDLGKVAIPQADEQQRLLVNLLHEVLAGRAPLPRFWYFPAGKKAVIIHTADNHGAAGTPVRFDAEIAASPAGCSLPDWECVRSSSYLYAGSGLTDAQVQQYQNAGFEIGIHLNTGCADWTPASLDQAWADQRASAEALYPSLRAQVTHRTHCIAWSDWASQPAIEAARGVRLDCNYYYWPPTWVQDRPGVFTGSAMPMRFAGLDGSLIDCYQAATQMTDESGQSYPATCNTLLDRALGPEGYYGAYCTNIHEDGSSETISSQIVAAAQARGVPVVSGEQMLAWLDGRSASRFDDLAWNGSTLTFALVVGAGARNLRAMLPVQQGAAGLLGLTRDGSPVAWTTETIKGVDYAMFAADSGLYAASFGIDASPPVIGAVAATPGPDGTALVEWTTDEPADSRVDYGTDPGTLSLSASSAALVTAHAVTLTGLAPSTTYHYRVTSADAAANAATSPEAPNAPATFTTPSGPCALDDAVADFAGGVTSGAVVTDVAGGEVSLSPAAVAEFGGTSLPAGWTSANGAPWNGGTPVVSGGQLAVNGCIAGTSATFSPGSSVEFVATFPAEAFLHVGFVGDVGFNDPWAIVSTGSAGDGVYARSNTNTSGVLLAGATLGAPHRYRIDWTASAFVFSVDGVPRATINQTAAGPMIVAASDLVANGTSLTLDWLRVLPYGAAGQFTSRVFDAGQAVNWEAATWTADLPSGTSLGIEMRTGDVAVPDGSWTAFAPLASSGTQVGAHARYLQYRADLATTNTTVTPELQRLEVACSSGTDVTPPVITNVSAASSTDGTSALVSWATNEPATSVVDYGTDAGTLGSSASSATLVTSHAVTLPGLTPGTTYHYRVTSADASANAASEPIPPATRSFTTSEPPCRADSLTADFAAGTRAGTYVAETADGEVTLAPAEGCEFTGPTLPAGWGSADYGGGGTVTLSGTAADLDGAFVRSDAFYTVGRTVEFVARFDATANGQHGGFGNTLNENTWAIFSTGPGGTLLARTNANGTAVEQDLGSAWLGALHRFRVDWKADSAVFWIDGQRVAGLANAVPGPLRPIVSDGPVGGTPLHVEWLRMGPYAASGTFDSRVYDAGGAAAWGTATWDALTPAGTSLGIEVRTGDTAVPDGTWSSFAVLPASGSPVAATSRYLQYRASLASGDPVLTPELRAFGVACGVAPDVTPPVITNAAATPSLTSAVVTWTTDEPADSRVDYGTDAGTLGSSQSSPALVTSHSVTLTGLAAGTTYHYRVTSADASANAASEPVPPATLVFTTQAPTCLTDAVAADFVAGTFAGTVVTETTDGEVMLAPAIGDEFSGTTLDAAWASVPWSGGTTTLSGGQASVDGARLTPLATSGQGIGIALEFVASFGAAAYQNAGLGAGDNGTSTGGMFATGDQPWAMFGTAGTTNTLFTRLNPGGDVSIGGADLGAPHRYRIEWFTGAGGDSVAFYVDGASVDRRASTIPGGTTMRPGFSDYALGAPALLVDWARMSPHPASGTFTSRVYDSGGIATWERLSWSADTPAGTAIALSVRTGDTPVPDGTWTAYQPVAASGDVVGGSSRYVQYQAALSTSDPNASPALLDASLACTVCSESTPPPAIADLAATGTGNAGNGRAHVRLDWSGVGAGHTVSVYRKGRGDHPLYRPDRSGVPAVPATPAAALGDGWVLSPVVQAAGLDDPPARDQWFYVAFVRNTCGLASPPSNLSGGALDYVLGDVSDGATNCAAGGEAGDGLVSTPDLSVLGSSYGAVFDTTDGRVCLDVGPTVDGGVRSLPAPDGTLDFEDLVIYALNYQIPLAGPARATPARAAKPGAAADGIEALALVVPAEVRAGEAFDAVVRYRGAGRTRAISARLSWNTAAVRWEGHDAGALLAGAGGVALSPRDGTLDAAVLGGGEGALAGEGDLVVAHLRALRDGAPGVTLASADARDGDNHRVVLGRWEAASAPDAPHATALGALFPNPFRSEVSVSFSLAHETRVRIAVFDLAGRAVRRLEDGPRPAGFHVVTWDGRLDGGLAAAPGTYLVRFEAAEIHQTRRVQLVR